MLKQINIFAIIIFSLSCSQNISTKEISPARSYSINPGIVEISGRIKNFVVLKRLLTDETNVVLFDLNMKLTQLAVDKNGNVLFPDKDLPKAKFSDDGNFIFQLNNLQNGKYAFIIQPIQRYGSTQLYDLKSKKLLELNIINDGQFVSKIDLGDLNAGTP
jgi:hypothetical protein